MTESPKTSTAPPAGQASRPFRYGAALANDIEMRWQRAWADRGTFETPNPGDPGFDASRPKFYCLDMFPYPSGAGLHVGHPEGYTATDIISRYKRHRGFNVLHPMGWDAFGLPAEQYAIQTGVHPAVTTTKAIDNFRRQLQRFGFSYDWSREVGTCDPAYYRWTQWIWLKAYNAWYDGADHRARHIDELVAEFAAGSRPVRYDPDAPGSLVDTDEADRTFGPWSEVDEADRRRIVDSYRLAYLSTETVNWCPKLGTVLANEEVIDGRSERGAHPVLRRPLRQWMFRITAFAERLLADMATVSWPDSTVTMQREWIGRSEGAEVDFPVADDGPRGADAGSMRVFTTRPDTIFGATYMVLAPEHRLVGEILEQPWPETDVAAVQAYVEQARHRSDLDRMADTREKTGVFTGAYATNPADGERIPIWVADYVLAGYGHGAIMAVPAHDERDFEFAIAFDLPIVDVVHPARWAPVTALVSDTAAPASADAASAVTDDVATGTSAPSANDVAAAAREGRLVTLLGAAVAEAGVSVNSTNDEVTLSGRSTSEAKAAIIDWLESTGRGRRRINYKLRDWLFSRQRYWGEPFPVVYDESGEHYSVGDAALPVALPELDDYRPVESEVPTPPLGKATAWLETTAGEAGVDPAVLPPDSPVRRETNTMPGWAGSCWYYLRFCDPHNEERPLSREAERYWMLSRKDGAAVAPDEAFDPAVHHVGGIDLYIGGAEHAVLHLLYARFWHKILFDLGEVSTPEPFGKLFHQGLITSYAYQRDDRSLVPVDEVDEPEEGVFIERATGNAVAQTVTKMSKSLKNVVNPDDIIVEFGADTFRLYEMYMGPLEASKPWNTRDISGLFRFLQRTWRLVIDEDNGSLIAADATDPAIEKQLHRTIEKVGADIERIALNTAIAAMIEFVNAATGKGMTRDQLERFAVVLAPFAPHMAEELWSKLGHESMVADQPWPTVDPAMLVDDEVEIAVQVNGKVRARVMVPTDADDAAMEERARADERIAAQLEGKTVRKVIVVRGRMVNIVAG